MSNLEKNKETAQAFLKALGESDVATIDQLLTDDVQYWVIGSIPLSGTHTKAALLQMLGGVAASGLFKEPLALKTTGLTAEGNRVALEAKGNVAMTSGKFYKNDYHFLFEFRDGRISHLREYMDPMAAQEAFS